MAKRKYITYKKQLDNIDVDTANNYILELFNTGAISNVIAKQNYEFVKVYNDNLNNVLLNYIDNTTYTTDKFIVMLIDLPTLFAKGEIMVYDGDDIHDIKFISVKTVTEKKALIKYLYDTYASDKGLIVRFYTQGLPDSLVNYIFLLNSKK